MRCKMSGAGEMARALHRFLTKPFFQTQLSKQVLMTTLIHPPRESVDRALQEQAFRTLEATGYPAMRGVDCRVRDGVVDLRGEVPSFYFKQIAQSAVLSLRGVRSVRNHLRVC